MAKNGTLLWIDDEIELLRAHILFLKGKEYEVDTATNGRDALDRQVAFPLGTKPSLAENRCDLHCSTFGGTVRYVWHRF